MKRTRSQEEKSTKTLHKYIRKNVPNPDIPLDTSGLVEVQELIRKNNAEANPKRRLRLIDFLNEAFCTIALEAKKNSTKAEVVLRFFQEFITLHSHLPRGETLSQVLYAWLNCTELLESGKKLVKAILASRSQLPELFVATFDDRVATGVLRFLIRSKSGTNTEKLLEAFQLIPPESLKRRVFSPLLSYACEIADVLFALEVLRRANASSIELWDEDFNNLFTAISYSCKQGLISHDGAYEAAEEVLKTMEKYHSVTGSRNAKLIKEILLGEEVTIEESSTSGVCSRCKSALNAFDLDEHERRALLNDILEKLIKPRFDSASHYETNKTVTKVDEKMRMEEFDHFKDQLAQTSYDTLIDGANVGYHGLSSWYAEAKEKLLQLQGNDPRSVPLSERLEPPQPVDVPPKFSLIEDMRKALAMQGKKPLIVLHKRHLPELERTDAGIFQAWTEQGAILFSPAFLNDDYCWLYAAVQKPNSYIVSNDQMRDHHFSILSPRFFLRWRQRHRATYTIFFNSSTKTTSLTIHMPRPYSVWIQSALKAAVRHWHVPYIAVVPILEQATNRVTSGKSYVALSKDGDDFCTGWLCTYKADKTVL